MHKATDTVALLLNVNTERPLQAQLFEQVRAMILDGQLKAGAPLPATRALSEQLGISRNTVVLAYDRLLLEGYIESKRSIGTFVTEALPDRGVNQSEAGAHRSVDETAFDDELELDTVQLGVQIAARYSDFLHHDDDNLFEPLNDTGFGSSLGSSGARTSVDFENGQIEIDFRPRAMDPDLFPERSWRRIYNRKCNQVEHYLDERPSPLGLYELRRAIADHLGPARGILTSPQEVVIVGSEQEGRALLSQLLLTTLDGESSNTLQALAILEAPGPRGMAQLVRQAGAKRIEIPVDDDGLRTELLPELKSPTNNTQQNYGMVYVTPSQQFTLGGVMPLARRLNLLEWAQSNGLMVVEDETDSDIRYSGSPLTALKGLDHQGGVIYLGGFETVMGPGMGLGFLVLPRELVAAATLVKSLNFSGPMALEQAAMAEFLDSGAYDRHLRKLKKKAKEKRDFLVASLHKSFGDLHLKGLELSGLDGGLQLSWHLPKALGTAENVARMAREHAGLGLYTVTSGGSYASSLDEEMAQTLIFGFGNLSIVEIDEGIQRLSGLVTELHKKTKTMTIKSRAIDKTPVRMLNTDLGVIR